MTITSQSQGKASKRFIREVLPEEYKEKIRVLNAKKQKKKKAIKEDEKLAVLTPLNPDKEIERIEEEKEKKKIVAIVANDGSSVILEDDANSPDKTSFNNHVDTPINPEQTFDSQITQDDVKEQLKNKIRSDLKDLDVKEHVSSESDNSTSLNQSDFRNKILMEIPVSVYENNIGESKEYSYFNFACTSQ